MARRHVLLSLLFPLVLGTAWSAPTPSTRRAPRSDSAQLSLRAFCPFSLRNLRLGWLGVDVQQAVLDGAYERSGVCADGRGECVELWSSVKIRDEMERVRVAYICVEPDGQYPEADRVEPIWS